MGIKTVPHPPYSPDLAPCDVCLFPKLRGCRYETIEEMKEAMTKVIDMLTQEDFDGTFQKLLEWHNKCIAGGGDYFEGDLIFMYVLWIKVPIRKKFCKFFNDPRTTAWGKWTTGNCSRNRNLTMQSRGLCTNQNLSLRMSRRNFSEIKRFKRNT